MVQHHRHLHQSIRKGDHVTTEQADPAAGGGSSCAFVRKTRPKLFCLFLLSLFSCAFILALHLFCSSSPSLLKLYSFGLSSEIEVTVPRCSSTPSGSICCDRSKPRTDVCLMEGDVRTDPATFSISVYGSRASSTSHNMSSVLVTPTEPGQQEEQELLQLEKIKPYTRKWETSVMDTIDQLELTSKNCKLKADHHCDIWHNVPAIFFSTGGYTGNVYHEFNDGILPLYITSQHFNRKVVFVILEYHEWWITKYADILPLLSDYPPIDFSGDRRKHCFPRAIVGLSIHDELTVDPSLMMGNKSIIDFRNLLDKAYRPRISSLSSTGVKSNAQDASPSPLMLRYSSQGTDQQLKSTQVSVGGDIVEQTNRVVTIKKPKLVILSRNGSRAIINEGSMAKMAAKCGFEVQVLRPNPTTELAKVYKALNSSDVMVGVHGAAMTHFLFMRPGCVFIQVIPLGTEWAAEAYYGEPAKKLGLKYIGYKILVKESSLYSQYEANDPILKDPDSVNEKGWQLTKKIYLDGQNVILNLQRFEGHLMSAYDHIKSSRSRHPMLSQ
uniref:Glycosyltransferase 61 catalytic domain-containing protein n=2 Tax=Kalanchoe fedtschenkoi TaxID=63787 RepID=A0A7N0TUV8_KALFE